MARDDLSIERAKREKEVEHIPFPAKGLLLYS